MTTTSEIMPHSVTFISNETVTTPAGKFETWHYRLKGTDLDHKPYVSDMWFDVKKTVPVLHLVQVVANDTKLSLEAFGDGAKSDLPPFAAAEN